MDAWEEFLVSCTQIFPRLFLIEYFLGAITFKVVNQNMNMKPVLRLQILLTAVLVETGAMPVPTKSQNPTVCG